MAHLKIAYYVLHVRALKNIYMK